MNPLFLSFTTLLLLILTTTATATTVTTPIVGVTLDPTRPNLPPLDSIITVLIQSRISSVRLIDPTPYSIHAFSSTNITLIISIPETLLHSFASDQSSSATWLTNNILPFHNAARILLISIDTTNHLTPFHLPALRHIYWNLVRLGIDNVKISTTLHFNSILVVKDWFAPSEVEFYQPELIRLLVRFLKSVGSPFLVTVYPYNVYRDGYNGIPLRFAIFQDYRFNIRTDDVTGIQYLNLYDMMVDALVFALERLGEGNVPVIVAETGWPSETVEVKSDAHWAPFYLNGLLDHLKKSGSRKVDEVYVYELFGDEWGIMDGELNLKYGLNFSGFGVHEIVSNESDYRVVLWLWALFFVLLLLVLGFRKNGLKVVKVS